MTIVKNVGVIDRIIRVFLAEVLFIGAFFFLWGAALVGVLALSVIIFLTGVFGFCGAYKIVGVNTCRAEGDTVSTRTKIILVILFVLVAVFGSYYSDFFSRKIFLDDYTQMNASYKQALFYTGQEKREEALNNYNDLVVRYALFEKKYTRYHPFVLHADAQFNSDVMKAGGIIVAAKEGVYTGDLKGAHGTLEGVRPIFQDILKRNGFSMLAITLVDFHDAMEKIIVAADAKDPATIIMVYPEVDAKLVAVEEVANDQDIQLIRQRLNEVLQLAQEGKVDELSEKAAAMKSAFVKVYLTRG